MSLVRQDSSKGQLRLTNLHRFMLLLLVDPLFLQSIRQENGISLKVCHHPFPSGFLELILTLKQPKPYCQKYLPIIVN